MFKTIITNVEALRMTIKTDHFNPITDPKLLCTCGHKDCDKRSVKLNTLRRLEEVRVLANRPLTVTSGGRCPNHKNELVRVTPADHQQGIGIDIAVSGGMERAQLVTLGLKRGFNAIGIAKTFVHLGYREGQQPVMWVY
tara:strand:- start:108 stop:524 length:417 start_codon:yes stop_codon:yes gene_type:complete